MKKKNETVKVKLIFWKDKPSESGLLIATASEVCIEAKVIKNYLDLITFGSTKSVLTANFKIYTN